MRVQHPRTSRRHSLPALLILLAASAPSQAFAESVAPPPQNNPSMALLPSASVGVLYGGWIVEGDSRHAGAETWTFGARGWRLVPTKHSPGPRAFHCSATCGNGDGVLLFGGSKDGVRLNDTWRFDGADWTLASQTGPPPRSSSCMAFDPVRNRVVLFGGRGENGLLGDTWEWDGSAWRRAAQGGPSARRHHVMAFDPVGGGVLLFGGATNDGPSGETWSWDGAAWTLLEPAMAPTARDHHGMASDPARERIVLFGGWDGESELGDTWVWNGEAWDELEAHGSAPAARGGRPAMLFDSHSASLILYGGGFTDEGPRTDVWRLENDRWMRLDSPDSDESGE